jgi:hypothetical protein
MKLRVMEVHATANAKTARVVLQVPAEEAAGWLGILGKDAEAAVAGATRPRKAAAAAKRSRERKHELAAREASEQGRRKKRRAKEQEPEVHNFEDDGKAYRQHVPEGWLLVSDFAATIDRTPQTVYNWIARNKLYKHDVREVDLPGRANVKLIRETATYRSRKVKKPHPIKRIVDHRGAPEAAERLGVSTADIGAWYRGDEDVPAELHDAVLALAAELNDLAQKRKALPEDATSGPQYVPKGVTPGARIREQLPAGWLTVGDYAASVGVKPGSVYGWLDRGKIAAEDRVLVSVRGAKVSQVTAIREGSLPRGKYQKQRRPGALARLVDKLGLDAAAEAIGADKGLVVRWYANGRVHKDWVQRVKGAA